MKIALNIEHVGARRGGAEKYAGSLARSLAAAGHEVHVVARQVDLGELPPEVQVHPVPLRHLPGLSSLRAYRFAAASETVLRGLGLDLILGFSKVWYQDAYLALGGPRPAALECSHRRLRSLAVRTLWQLGKLLNPKHWMFRLIDHKTFHSGRPTHVIAPSRMSADHFVQYHGMPRERISVVYNGLEPVPPLADAAAVRRDFRRRQGLRDDDVVILFVARNYDLKGLEPLLEAFRPVVDRYPQARLLVCGSRREAAHRQQAQRLGLAGRVQFLGFVDDVRECFAGADLFAFPTFYDPCSLVVLEAMAAGLPVVTTRQNGASELLQEGIDGFVIDSPWAVEQLTHRLLRLVGNEPLRHYMGQEGARHVAAFTLDVRVQELLAVLQGIASRPSSRLRLERKAA